MRGREAPHGSTNEDQQPQPVPVRFLAGCDIRAAQVGHNHQVVLRGPSGTASGNLSVDQVGGVANRATVEVLDAVGAGSAISLVQSGSLNDATIALRGGGNTATVEQSGFENQATLAATGENHLATAIMRGDRNAVRASQTGQGHRLPARFSYSPCLDWLACTPVLRTRSRPPRPSRCRPTAGQGSRPQRLSNCSWSVTSRARARTEAGASEQRHMPPCSSRTSLPRDVDSDVRAVGVHQRKRPWRAVRKPGRQVACAITAHWPPRRRSHI